MGGDRSLPVAEILAGRRIPIMFTPGCGQTGLPPEHKNAVAVQKPFVVSDLSAALNRLLRPAD